MDHGGQLPPKQSACCNPYLQFFTAEKLFGRRLEQTMQMTRGINVAMVPPMSPLPCCGIRASRRRTPWVLDPDALEAGADRHVQKETILSRAQFVREAQMEDPAGCRQFWFSLPLGRRTERKGYRRVARPRRPPKFGTKRCSPFLVAGCSTLLAVVVQFVEAWIGALAAGKHIRLISPSSRYSSGVTLRSFRAAHWSRLGAYLASTTTRSTSVQRRSHVVATHFCAAVS